MTELFPTSKDLLHGIVQAKPGGEVRKQQETAVDAIEEAIKEKNNLLLEAPTGSGKGFSYLTPVIQTGTRAVVSTATKQLSEQLAHNDAPFLEKTVTDLDPALGFTHSLLKGRDNYYCLSKAEEAAKLDRKAESLFDLEASGSMDTSSSEGRKAAGEIRQLNAWAEKTKTGDRTEAPAVSDKTWRNYSSSSAECPGKRTCVFGDQCFAEKARDKAKESDIVFTNHAVVAHDFKNEEDSVFGDRDVFVFDELHELDNYVTNAWSVSLSQNMLKDAVKAFRGLRDLSEADIDAVERVGKAFKTALKSVEFGVIQGEQKDLGKYLKSLYNSLAKVNMRAKEVAKDKDEGEKKRVIASRISKRADEIMEACEMLMNAGPETVRWLTMAADKDGEKYHSLHAAPLQIGPALQSALAQRDAVMVGTSATITVGGSFEIPVHNLGLKTVTTPYKAVSLPSPFNFWKQAMLYVPTPDSFPEPVGADRTAHTQAVQKTTAKLVKAMNGRALCLFTTTQGAKDNAAYLRKTLPDFEILLQGEAPNTQLVQQFKDSEHSVLVATLGMWQGLDVPGQALSLVIMDKIPFGPMDEPLLVARKDWAEKQGRNGFMDIYVGGAQATMSQGEGRLVRSQKDRGIVAILDPRLHSKPYGRSMLAGLPMRKATPASKLLTKESDVVAALERLDKLISDTPE